MIAAALRRIRARLLVVNLLIVAVPVAGFGFARVHERELLRAVENDMVDQARAIGAMILADGEQTLARYDGLLADAARGTRMRVRILDPGGAVRSDSTPNAPEEVSQRPEVQRALHGHYGSKTRLLGGGVRSLRGSASSVQLYAALPIFSRSRSHAHDHALRAIVYVQRSTSSVKVAMYHLRTTLLRVFFIAAALTAILSLFLAATIARPLSTLTAAAGRIAAGDRTIDIPATLRRDEIGELAGAVHAMVAELDGRARHATALAADISHEFKSPLTGIRGAAELLLDGAADDPPARARFLAAILGDCHRLDRLVTRLLELARVEAENARPELFDYQALIVDLTRSRPRVTVAYEGPRRLRARPGAIASVLRNLLDNAQQHAIPGTPITLRVSSRGDQLQTEVHDVGAVIPTADQSRIWDRFFTTRAHEGGTGLGLPITRAIVRAHGGAVSVASSVEAGTTFYFTLPTTSS